MAKSIVGAALILVGLSGLQQAVSGQILWLWALAPLALLVGSFFLSNRSRLVSAAMAAVLLPAFLIARAGPLGSFDAEEWRWFLLMAALMFVPLASIGWLWRQRRRLVAVMASVVFLVTVPLHATWIKTQVNPVALKSITIPMRDGMKIALDFYLPRDLAAGEQLPTVLHQTRYHRNFNWVFPYNRLIPPWARGADQLAQARIAWVKVDVRGSGASEGSRPSSFSDAEIADGAEIVDWIIGQSWSDGSVVSEGVSYVGTTAEFLLSNRHPAVKAAMPAFALYDGYRDIVWPGGLYMEQFADLWSLLNTSLDANHPERAMPGLEGLAEGVRPVDNDSGVNLAGIISRRTENYVPNQVFGHLVYADGIYQSVDLSGPSSWRHKADIKASGTPMLMISGWYDGAYANGAIRRFLNTPNPGSKLLLGPWDHGGNQFISPCDDDPDASPINYFGVLTDLVNHVVRGESNAFSAQAPVRYYTMCGKGWQSANHWPPNGMSELVLYLSAEQTLTEQLPASGERQYEVDLTAKSTEGSRWVSYVNQAGLKIGYPNRAEEDQKLLVFESEPLGRGMEITGHPEITLHMSANSTDAAVFVYLEDVGPSGDVRYITEGQIRALHRKVSDKPLPFSQIGVNRTFNSGDALPLIPGEAFELKFELLPTSYYVRPGRKLRIAIAGADNGHFRQPDDAATSFDIHSGETGPSQIVLPVAMQK